MVLTDFKTGNPLVPGDMNYDDSKPTAENVLQIFDTFKSHYEEFHNQCEEEDEYYHGTRSVPIPDDMPIDPVRPATAHAIVNVATITLMSITHPYLSRLHRLEQRIDQNEYKNSCKVYGCIYLNTPKEQ